MNRYLNLFKSSSVKKGALEDAYRIHGDGVARMIPERLVQRETFQQNLTVIADLEIDTEVHQQKKPDEEET